MVDDRIILNLEERTGYIYEPCYNYPNKWNRYPNKYNNNWNKWNRYPNRYKYDDCIDQEKKEFLPCPRKIPNKIKPCDYIMEFKRQVKTTKKGTQIIFLDRNHKLKIST